MAQATLKKKIHKVIDDIDDEAILEAIYTILNTHTYSSAFKLSDEDLRVIEDRKASYKSGKTKMLTRKELATKLQRKLGK